MSLNFCFFTFTTSWSEAESEPGIVSTKIGVFREWEEFYKIQNAEYSFMDYCLPVTEDENVFPKPKSIGFGLDCSGFVGWIVYNVVNTENRKESFVCKARIQA